MANEADMKVPAIADSDIEWVCATLGLPATAFSGADGTDPRLSIMRSMDMLDVEACPGSGKTTLLVAKLAILARKWTERRRGLCVLSHTNVARREIETRLGSTVAGQRLLGYPHFIGTIHGFVNEFLALPWLRSSGYPIEMIDDEVCLAHRWRRLPNAIRRGLEANHYSEQILRYKDKAFGFGDIRWGRGTLGPNTQTYQTMVRVCTASAQAGYFCHDEMFVWAHDMLDTVPNVVEYIRTRFPFLFVDEVQDNSEPQSRLLYRVFMDGEQPVTRQRLGDANQAIYQSTGQAEAVELDVFPTREVRRDMPNSFRFDQSIADLTDPLAVEPQRLTGLRQHDAGGMHTILLFDDSTVRHVLNCYAQLLTSVFSDSVLKTGSFTAIGAVHRPGGNDHVPRSVHHYWTAYDYEISLTEPQPRTLVQYVAAGNRLARQSGEAHASIEKLAEGLLRLVKLSRHELKLGKRKRRHLYVLELLEEQDVARERYLDLVKTVCVDRMPLTRAAWENDLRHDILQIASVICGEGVDAAAAHDFLAWDNMPDPVEAGDEQVRSDNIYHYSIDNSSVEIRVGSIHSAKGETHTATLVLDTFYRVHHIKSLKEWLTGEKAGGRAETQTTKSRLRLHYVAMTRPSNLLCLAMREDALATADIEQLIERGWSVGRVTDAGIEWLAHRRE